MSLPTSLDRRRLSRAQLDRARRRYPRLSVHLDAFYESDARALWVERVDLSLRGVFLPCAAGDAEGAEGTVRIALPGAAEMVKARVVVLRQPELGGTGIALRFVEMSEAHRSRLAAFLLRSGGLAQIPRLEARFGGWARMDHPLLRSEHRRMARAG